MVRPKWCDGHGRDCQLFVDFGDVAEAEGVAAGALLSLPLAGFVSDFVSDFVPDFVSDFLSAEDSDAAALLPVPLPALLFGA